VAPGPTTRRSTLLALLVLLAGCGSVAQSPATPRATVTPAPVPTDSPTPRPERATVPEPLVGATPDPTALARLHAESLSRRSYRLGTYHSRSRGESDDRPAWTRLDRRSYRVQSGGTYRAERVVLVVGPARISRRPQWRAFADGRAEYRRVVAGDDTAYERRQLATAALPPHQGRAVAMLVRYLDVGRATVEHVRTERGPRLRVVGRDPQPPSLGDVSAYRVEAVVAESGRVERLEASYLAADGSAVSVGFRVIEVGGVRVDPPDWYGEARAATLDARTPTATPGAVNDTVTPTPVSDRAVPRPPSAGRAPGGP